jgi:chromosome segregation ATPase
MNTNIPIVSDSLKKTLRELSGLKELAEALDHVGSIAQAEGEAIERHRIATAAAEAAKADAATAIAQAREDADRQIATINGDIERLQATRQALADAVAEADQQRAYLETQIADAETHLATTRGELARIAARIG